MEKARLLLLLRRNWNEDLRWSEGGLQELQLLPRWRFKRVRTSAPFLTPFRSVLRSVPEDAPVSAGWTTPSWWAWWGRDPRKTSGWALQTRGTSMLSCGPTQTKWSSPTGMLGCPVRETQTLRMYIFSVITTADHRLPEMFRSRTRLCCYGNGGFRRALGSPSLLQ